MALCGNVFSSHHRPLKCSFLDNFGCSFCLSKPFCKIHLQPSCFKLWKFQNKRSTCQGALVDGSDLGKAIFNNFANRLWYFEKEWNITVSKLWKNNPSLVKHFLFEIDSQLNSKVTRKSFRVTFYVFSPKRFSEFHFLPYRTSGKLGTDLEVFE